MFSNNSLPSECREKSTGRVWRALELFAGLGGFAAAWPELEFASAIDVSQVAQQVYAANFKHRYYVREIGSMSAAELSALGANLWWLSPPCQPYTHRGARRDIHDSRAQSFLHLIDLIKDCQPSVLMLENVVGIEDSQAHAKLVAMLDQNAYHIQTIKLCPTQLNWPNRRERFYLMAARVSTDFAAWRPLPSYRTCLQDLIEPSQSDSTLNIAQEVVEKYFESLDRIVTTSVEVTPSEKPSACFGSSYGKAILNAGSYLVTQPDECRRFSPREVANMLGFPPTFRLPTKTNRQAWKLLGNSLSLPVVRYLLSHLNNGPSDKLPWYV